MRMDSFRAVCLPSALSLHRHPRLAFFFKEPALFKYPSNIRTAEPQTGKTSPSTTPLPSTIRTMNKTTDCPKPHICRYLFFFFFYRLQAHKHRLQTGIALTWSPLLLSFPDGNADREDMLFSFSFFPWVRITVCARGWDLQAPQTE